MRHRDSLEADPNKIGNTKKEKATDHRGWPNDDEDLPTQADQLSLPNRRAIAQDALFHMSDTENTHAYRRGSLNLHELFPAEYVHLSMEQGRQA